MSNQKGAGYSWEEMEPTRAEEARRNYNVSAKMVLGKYNTWCIILKMEYLWVR